jgi:hypothetical protein
MAHLPLCNSSAQTPMERIFEKVMLRKMTEEEREILELNVPVKAIKKSVVPRAGPARKTRMKGPRFPEEGDVN